MLRSSEFVDHLLDLLAPLGEVSARSMFGGWAMMFGGRMFALVARDVFYVKTDEENRAEFLSQNLEPFSYETKKGQRNSLAYYTVPTEALDSSPLLCEWAQKGIGAAERSAQKAAKPKAKRTKHEPKKRRPVK